MTLSMYVVRFSETMLYVSFWTLLLNVCVQASLKAAVCVLDMVQDSCVQHSITCVLHQALYNAEMLPAKSHYNAM